MVATKDQNLHERRSILRRLDFSQVRGDFFE